MTIELRLILLGVLALMATIGVIVWDVHERHKGAEVCQADDLKAAKAQIEKLTKDLATYQEQLGEAHDKLDEANRLIAVAASTPVPVLVCHKASPQPLPGVPTATPGEPATPGVPDRVRGSDFDPSPALRSLSAGYEGRVEQARDALNKWPQ